MANTLKFGNGEWYGKKDTILAYNSENNNYKPLPFDFSRESSATVVNKDGLIETVGSGEPRIDYKDNTKGSLLLEPSRSNLFSYSEDFSNAYWSKVGGAITSNIGISPDGGLNADRFYIANAVANTRLYVSYTFSESTYTLSVYAKNNGSTDSFRFSYYDGVSQEFSSNFSLTNEWQRFTHTFTAAAGAGAGVVWIATTSSTGVGSELDIQIYGAQLEVGSYATSYIPTSGSAVTRVADISSQTVPNNIVSSNEGTFFIDMNSWQSGSYGSSAVSFGLYLNGSQSNAVGFTSNQTTNNLRARISDDTGSDYIGTNFTPSTRDKLAIKWNGTTVSFFKNGSLFYSLANTGGKNYNTISLPISARTGLFPINDVRVYNTALTDQELIALTQ
jgi:hypothetical protein